MSALNGGPTLLAPPISFRAGAVKNIIIVTDEPSNGDLFGANWLNADALLKSNNALLNGILTPGSAGGLTPPTQSLGTLVLGNGGAVFSLNTFNTNNQATIDAFVQDFANRKLQEILDAGGQIPEPATLAVFGGIAVAGLFGYRRRKTTATA